MVLNLTFLHPKPAPPSNLGKYISWPITLASYSPHLTTYSFCFRQISISKCHPRRLASTFRQGHEAHTHPVHLSRSFNLDLSHPQNASVVTFSINQFFSYHFISCSQLSSLPCCHLHFQPPDRQRHSAIQVSKPLGNFRLLQRNLPSFNCELFLERNYR